MAPPFAPYGGMFSGSRDGRTGGSPISAFGALQPWTSSLWSAPIQQLTGQKVPPAMRAETEKLVDEIKQGITLLRRHL